MAKLNQIIAIEKGIKSRTYAEGTALHKAEQKPELFNGFHKEYKPLNDAGEALPPEAKRVQFTATDVLRQYARLNTEAMQITARKDFTNCEAKAAVKLEDGTEILPPCPVSYLLFLEKQLSDFHDVLDKMPVLDEASDWTYDEQASLWKTEPVLTHRTKKEVRPITLLEPTKEHPGQAQLITEDVLVGHWSQIKMSGAIPKPRRQELLERCEKIQAAVKQAREHANMHDEVSTPKVGDAIYGYLLGE
jgi:hypothetical protein